MSIGLIANIYNNMTVIVLTDIEFWDRPDDYEYSSDPLQWIYRNVKLQTRSSLL